jgi:hypothetical protein
MSFEYVSVEEAIKGRGLRMVVVGDVPSPWGEAAKGFLHIKGINWVAVRLTYDSEPLKQWAGQRSGPVAVYENERPRSGWAEILLMAERLTAKPSLLPTDLPMKFVVKVDSAGRAACNWCTPASTARAVFPNASRNIWARSTATAPRNRRRPGRSIAAYVG